MRSRKDDNATSPNCVGFGDRSGERLIARGHIDRRAQAVAAGWVWSTTPCKSRCQVVWRSRCCRLPPCSTRSNCSVSKTKPWPPPPSTTPNIVHVYGLGCERGVHFFAMQLIEGKSLAEVIAETQAGQSGERKAKSGEQRGPACWRSSVPSSHPLAPIPHPPAPSLHSPASKSQTPIPSSPSQPSENRI